MHGKWHNGEGEESFSSNTKKMQDLLAMLKNDPNHKMHKDFPNAVKYIEESLSKISWEDYQKNYFNADFCLGHGDCHPKQMMWNTAQQKNYLLDFEFVKFGPYIGDICYFMLNLGSGLRVSLEERLLARYHE